MRAVHVNVETETAVVSAGATTQEAYDAVASKGFVIG